MDAATAAAMSDPDCNPYFRRRWDEGRPDAAVQTLPPVASSVGALGIALQEALHRAQGQTAAVRPAQPPEGPTDG